MAVVNTVIVTDTSIDVVSPAPTSVSVVSPSSKVLRLPNTYALGGLIDPTTTLPGFFISTATGQTARLVKVLYGINSGTSQVFTIIKNGVAVTGLTSLSATTASNNATVAISLTDGDKIGVTLGAATGSPVDLSITIVVEYSI